jgi:hypothetical protein
MSDGKPPRPEEKRTTGKLSLAELIAQTPGAQPREQLVDRINARQQKRSKEPQKPAPSEEELSKPEPMNIISDPYSSAPDVLQRILANAKAIRSAKQREEREAQSKPTKGFRLRLVVNNHKERPPKRSKKRRDKDNDDVPPSAA